MRSDQGARDLENHTARCVLRRAYLAAASTRGSELGCLVLGDFNHTLSDVRDVMNCITQDNLEVAAWAHLRKAALDRPWPLVTPSPRAYRLLAVAHARCFMFVVG